MHDKRIIRLAAQLKSSNRKTAEGELEHWLHQHLPEALHSQARKLFWKLYG